MSRFKITWSQGHIEEVVQEEAATLEQFIAIQFGSAWDAAIESGVTVEHLEGEFLGEPAPATLVDASTPTPEDQPAAPEAPAETAPASGEELGQTQQP